MIENKVKWEDLFPEKIEFEVLVSVAPENMEWRMWHVATEKQRKNYIDYQLVKNGIDIQILNTVPQIIRDWLLPDEFIQKPLYCVGNFYTDNIENAKKIASVVNDTELYDYYFINQIRIYEKRKKNISVDTVSGYIEPGDGTITAAAEQVNKKIKENTELQAHREPVVNAAQPFIEKFKEMDKKLIDKYNRMENMYNLYNNYVHLTFYDDMIFNLLDTIHQYSKEEIDDFKELLDLAKRNGTDK